MEAKGDDVDEEEDARRQRKWDRDNLNNDRKKKQGDKRRSRKVKTGAEAADQYEQLQRAKQRDDRLIETDHKSDQNDRTQRRLIRRLKDTESWDDE
jgi:hypothetical protein